ncbi:tetratricopeptide repeat protein [Rhizohabitans arisaemae]|uniref:tetratricopeptide repeat protein n=1 Tax=Rhizohabitans arisaemae TaxID=2720610 RepID=UPI0024B2672D|nr:tetratricopeptide repeat protein [Rhizohabitans arisaemae]
MTKRPVRLLGTAAAIAGVLGLTGPGAPLTISAADGHVSAPPPAQDGTPEAFVAAVQAYLRTHPDDARWWAALADGYLRQARSGADPAYHARARRAVEHSLRLQPAGNVEALITQGNLAIARHDFRQARRSARQALALDPASAAAYGVLADAHLNLGAVGEATTATQRMLDLRPGVASFVRAANLLTYRGAPGRAARVLSKALAMASAPEETASCEHRLGELAWSRGRPREALAAYRRALSADPGMTAALVGAGRAEAALGRTEQALNSYRTAVIRHPEPTALLELGELYTALGRHADARRQFAVLAAHLRLNTADALTAGRYHADHGDPGLAVRYLLAEWRRRPAATVADALGWALHKAGRDTRALRYASHAGTGTALFVYHRAEIERSLGRFDQAQIHLGRALRLNPHFSPIHAPRARAALAKLNAVR